MSIESTHPASEVKVRYEEPGDIVAVRKVNEAAFAGLVEAGIVDALRVVGAVTLSMVAVVGGEEIAPSEAVEAANALSACGGEGEGWGAHAAGVESDGATDGWMAGAGLAPARVVGGEVIGHALVTPVTLTGEQGEERLLGLGPVAVLPEHQGRGAGTLLVETCLEHLRDSGVAAVVVFGNPRYYGRFGFIAASRWGIRWEAEAPEEDFMALELQPGKLAGKTGLVRYRPEFRRLAGC
jgi:predicted N-acetyltransferase YhbS